MAYNNFFPMGYQQPYYQPVQQTQQGNGIIWVQGEAGAKSYLVAPNTTVQLWDSENQSIYLKSADASGMPSIKVLDYTIRQTSQPPKAESAVPEAEYVTKDELSALEKKLMDKLKEVSGSESTL